MKQTQLCCVQFRARRWRPTGEYAATGSWSRSFATNFQLPRIHQWDAIFEREIAHNTVVSVSYLGSLGQYLPNFVDVNLGGPTSFVNMNVVGGPFDGRIYRTPIWTGPRPITTFGQIQEIRSDITSKYHGLVLQFNRRMTNNLQ